MKARRVRKREMSAAQRLKQALSKVNSKWVDEKLEFYAGAMLQPNELERYARKRQTLSHSMIFVIPEHFAPRSNVFKSSLHWSEYAAIKAACETAMRRQLAYAAGPWFPLTERADVDCIRFTSQEPDQSSDWTKVPVDCLLTRRVQETRNGTRVRGGLGILQDDSRNHIDLSWHWEPGPKGDGFVLIRVSSRIDPCVPVSETELDEPYD